MRKNPTVEVVIINYKRPGNIKPILTRFKEQAYPCTITLVDQGGGLDPETYALANRVYSLRENYGCWNRYVFLGNYYHDYTYFHDDDMLPGTGLIKHFVGHALNKPDGALFGQWGCSWGENYVWTPVRCVPGVFTPTSMVVRSYFVRTKYLYTLLKFSRYFTHPITEDDILLSWALRTYTDKSIYVSPKPVGSSECMNEQELPQAHANTDRPDHITIRKAFWAECEAISIKIRKQRRAILAPLLKPGNLLG
jgi:hypothetical protein